MKNSSSVLALALGMTLFGVCSAAAAFNDIFLRQAIRGADSDLVVQILDQNPSLVKNMAEMSHALFVACMANTANIVNILLTRGADPDIHVFCGEAVLSLAVTGAVDARIVEMLLARSTNPNALSAGGYTALMKAVVTGNDAVVAVLLADPRIDIGLKNAQGHTATDIAIEKNHHSIAALLRQAEQEKARWSPERQAWLGEVVGPIPKALFLPSVIEDHPHENSAAPSKKKRREAAI